MNFNQAKFAAVVETAKQKATNSPRWIRAIEHASVALQSGELVVSLLHDGALVTSANGSYHVNGPITPHNHNLSANPDAPNFHRSFNNEESNEEVASEREYAPATEAPAAVAARPVVSDGRRTEKAGSQATKSSGSASAGFRQKWRRFSAATGGQAMCANCATSSSGR